MDLSINIPIRNFDLYMRHEHNVFLNGVFYEFPDEEKRRIRSISVELSAKEKLEKDFHKFLIEASFLLAKEINMIEENLEIILNFPISPINLNFALYVNNGAHLLWKGEYRFIEDPSFTLRSEIKSLAQGIDKI